MQQQYETFGNYILLEKLAAGGMAEVYLAKKIAASGVQKFVAVKRILSQFSDSENYIQMFKAEAKIAINLSHSNVVSIHDFGVQSGQFYIVMEFVEGRNLRQILNRMKRQNKYFTTSQVAYIIKQVAAGLDHAHRCIDPMTGQPLNIIHRDMSPQNVMLSFEGESKVVDFGIAKAETQLEATRAGTLKGKFGYMSPEQVEGQVIDSRTDIFALGIMIWEMLANQRLFLANSEINTLRKIRECNVPSLRKINPNIPSELDQIVLKALKKDKSQRYQTAAELNRDLTGFLSRFDPDFSVQDFSSFIKSLFSEEIIAIRKKQIVYSQVTVATKTNENEKTEVVTQTHNSEIIDGLSFDEMSLNTITKNEKGANSKVFRESKISNIDFSRAIPEVPPENREARIQNLRRDARNKAQAYRQNTFTNSAYSPRDFPRPGNDAMILTVIFALSFMLGLFAYINKFHPGFQTQICNSIGAFCGDNRGPASTGLSVKTDPPGASIYINNKKVGKSPYNLEKPKAPFKLGLSLMGYRTIVENVDNVPQNRLLSFALEKIPSGTLTVSSVGSEIYVDELQVQHGQTISVPANKNIRVKVVNPLNGRSKESIVQVKENEEKSLFINQPSSN